MYFNYPRRQLAIPRVDDRMVSARMHYSRHYRIAFGMTVRLTYNKIPPEINLLYVSCVQIKFCDLRKKVSKTANGAPYFLEEIDLVD